MSHAVYVHDISHVIVDNMQFMLGTSTSGGGYAGMDRFTLQDSVVQIFRLVGIISGTLYCRVADPGSGMNISDHFSESLETVFRVKNTYIL